MVDFFQFAENIKSYPTDKFLDDLAYKIESDKEVIDLQKQQWQSGQDSDGDLLGLYTKTTEILSFGKKKAGTILNALERGNDLTFFFDSTGQNTPLLLDKLGPRIFGLTPKNIDELVLISQNLAYELLNKNLL